MGKLTPHIFYVIYKLDDAIELDGRRLEAGFYKYTYDLAGTDIPHCCGQSKDGVKWEDCGLFKDFGDFQGFFEKLDPVPFKMEREEYVETLVYKGFHVPIFCDDYGQCFYCIFDNKVLSFGTFQSDYEDEVKSLIDYEIEKRNMVNTPCDGKDQGTTAQGN